MPDFSSYSEKALLNRVAGGDQEAFSELFYSWHQVLATHVFHITSSKELTQEIVQDVFLKIWMSRETLSEIDNFRAYLLVISRNHTLNALRKIAREYNRKKVWEKESGEPVEKRTDDPETICYSLIDKAIDHLPVRQREVYLLHRHMRLTYQEIAQKLNISRETVKTHLKLAVEFISAYVRSRLDSLVPLILASLNFF